jgi:hypothetical protein
MIRLEIIIDKENKIQVHDPRGHYWHAKDLAALPRAVASCLRGYGEHIKNLAGEIPKDDPNA